MRGLRGADGQGDVPDDPVADLLRIHRPRQVVRHRDDRPQVLRGGLQAAADLPEEQQQEDVRQDATVTNASAPAISAGMRSLARHDLAGHRPIRSQRRPSCQHAPRRRRCPGMAARARPAGAPRSPSPRPPRARGRPQPRPGRASTTASRVIGSLLGQGPRGSPRQEEQPERELIEADAEDDRRGSPKAIPTIISRASTGMMARPMARASAGRAAVSCDHRPRSRTMRPERMLAERPWVARAWRDAAWHRRGGRGITHCAAGDHDLMRRDPGPSGTEPRSVDSADATVRPPPPRSSSPRASSGRTAPRRPMA